MGLDVYFRRDIANVLRATACASDGSMGVAIQLLGDPELCQQLDEAGIPQEKLLQAYQMGVRNTLLSVGLAFGLEPVRASVQRRPEVSPGLAGLLWAEAPQDR
ncbi:MAG: hypothetical protein GWN58_27780 [Anaerolineae bacterium]|nr:hypothetical protein [Anaerolineae bacterium]